MRSSSFTNWPLYMEAGTICETGETGENIFLTALFWSFDGGIRRLNKSHSSPVFPPFTLSFQTQDFEPDQSG